MSGPATAQTRRSRNKALENEDAAQLKLGEDFDVAKIESGAVGPLSASEVKVVLDTIMTLRADNGKPAPESPVFKKTYDFVTSFKRFEDENTSTAARRALEAHQPALQPFEIAQIANLCPLEADEAKSLIPSLNDSHKEETDNDALQATLNEVAVIRRFQAPS